MKIAIIVPGIWYSDNPAKFSVDLSLYVTALAEAGHQPLLVCHAGSDYHVDYPVLAVPAEQYGQPQVWRALRLDAALVFTWMRQAALLRALQEAGVFVVAKGDSDGRVSVRLFPRHHFRMMMSGARTLWEQARTVRHWLRRYLFLSAADDAEVIASIAASDRTSVETESAKAHLGQMLAYHGRQDLAGKLCVLPHLVAETILTPPIAADRREKILAIGRWDDPQKDAPLLVKSLTSYLAGRCSTEVVLIGPGGEKIFSALCRQFPQVSALGAVPRPEIMRHLADARTLVVTSRWESFHIAAHEALCLGATVVGPTVIPVPDICRAGAYGTLAAGRHPRQIAAALEQEMRAWEQGQREPEQIAAFWRPRLSAKSSVRQLLQMMPQARLVTAD